MGLPCSRNARSRTPSSDARSGRPIQVSLLEKIRASLEGALYRDLGETKVSGTISVSTATSASPDAHCVQSLSFMIVS